MKLTEQDRALVLEVAEENMNLSAAARALGLNRSSVDWRIDLILRGLADRPDPPGHRAGRPELLRSVRTAGSDQGGNAVTLNEYVAWYVARQR